MRIGATARAALLAALALAGSVAAAPANAASIGGLGLRPATFDPSNPATRAYFILHARKGAVRREAAIVSNSSATAVRVDVDPVDGLTGITSGVVYANRGTRLQGTGAWVTPQSRTLVIPAHSQVREDFVVRVPAGAAAGDHLAGLAFEPAKSRRSAGNFSVTIVERAVIGVEVIVPGHAVRHARIFAIALAPLPGTTDPSAVVTFEDDGGRLCQPQIAVSVAGAHARRSASHTLSTILPGDRIAFPFPWPGALARGRYRVTAAVTHCGPPATRSAVADYLVAAAVGPTSASGPAVGPTAPLASASSGGAWWLYALVALAALVAGALAATLVRRRGAR